MGPRGRPDGHAGLVRGVSLADHFDIDIEIEILPDVVGGVGRGMALDCEGEAGAVAEGKRLGCSGIIVQFFRELRCEAGVFLAEGDDLKTHTQDAVPGKAWGTAGQKQLALDLGEVHGTEESAVEQVDDLTGTRLVEEYGQDGGGIENDGLSQATPPSRELSLPGGLR